MTAKGRKVLLKAATPATPPVKDEEVPGVPVTPNKPSLATSGPLKAVKTPNPHTPGPKMSVTIGAAEKKRAATAKLPWTQPHYPGMPRDGIVLAVDDPFYVRGTLRGPIVELSTNVYRAVKPSTSFSLVFHLVANKGQRLDAQRVIIITDEDA